MISRKNRENLQGTLFPLADANGNCVSFIDDAGNVQAHYVYDAFGGTVSSDGDMDDYFHFRFSSKYLDDQTGVYYYGFRYYSPPLGRWLNRDPIGERGGLLLYGFVRNSGVNKWDYLGTEVSCKDFISRWTEHIDDKLKQELKDAVKDCGLKVPIRIRCECCDVVEYGFEGNVAHHGYNGIWEEYIIRQKSITMCSNEKLDMKVWAGILNHELQHNLDFHCKGKTDCGYDIENDTVSDGFKRKVCSEMRAYSRFGHSGFSLVDSVVNSVIGCFISEMVSAPDATKAVVKQKVSEIINGGDCDKF